MLSVVFQLLCHGSHLGIFHHPKAVVQHVSKQFCALQLLSIHIDSAEGVINDPLALSVEAVYVDAPNLGSITAPEQSRGRRPTSA